MTVFTTALSVLLLFGCCTIESAKKQEPATFDHDFDGVVAFGRVLEKAASGSTVSREKEATAIDCSEVTLGADLYIRGGRVLRTFYTSDIAYCCERCHSMKTCTTFRRSRSSGSCHLINAKAAYYTINPESDFDVGGSLEQRVEPKSTAASSSGRVPDCRINHGIVYPNGYILIEGYAPTDTHCCAVCRFSSSCNSWYFDSRNEWCVLNRNTPFSRRASSSFSGGTILD